MIVNVERCHKGLSCYPGKNLVNAIYYTRSKRKALKKRGIKLLAKLLCNPVELKKKVSPGEHNQIAYKFGLPPIAFKLYHLNTSLRETCKSRIIWILLAPNMVQFAGVAINYLSTKMLPRFSTNAIVKLILQIVIKFTPKKDLIGVF